MPDDEKIALHGWRTRLDRWWSLRPWNPNPLLRASDRVQMTLRIVVVVAALIAVPAAGALGTAAYTDTAARIRAENAEKTAVPAIVADAPAETAGGGFVANARWHDGDRSGLTSVTVPAGAKPGDRVTVWLGPDGVPTAEPRGGDSAAMTGVGVGLGVLVGSWFCGWCLVSGTAWLLERRRGLRWDREWRRLSRPIREDRP